MLRTIALVVGITLTVLGLVLVGFYLVGVAEIIIEQPADRSWLFWGLGLAGFGATISMGGLALIALWLHLRKAER